MNDFPKIERNAEIEIDLEHLGDLLQLPRPNAVMGVWWDQRDGVLILSCTGPDMPAHRSNEPVSRRRLAIRRWPDWATTLDHADLEHDE